MTNPIVFFDVSANYNYLGRILIQLKIDMNPKTAKNYRYFCIGDKGLSYNGSLFHAIIPRFII